jgi:hypothetical protein
MGMSPERDAELTFRFDETPIDHTSACFSKAVAVTTAVVTGTLRVVGELSDFDHLLVNADIDSLRLSLFDYKVQNGGRPSALDRHTIRVDQLDPIKLVGDQTKLDLSGIVELQDRRLDVRATGSANLGILQGFSRDIRSSGQAELIANLQGPLDAPLFGGSAIFTNGRLRLSPGMPSLTGSTDAYRSTRAIRIEDVVARFGEGDVRFAGRTTIDGYRRDSTDGDGREHEPRYPRCAR